MSLMDKCAKCGHSRTFHDEGRCTFIVSHGVCRCKLFAELPDGLDDKLAEAWKT